MTDIPPDPTFTNIGLYREIALEALEISRGQLEERRRPRGSGSGGHVKTFDPHSRSFKQAMVCIVFAGMFMEGLLWLRGSRKLGVDAYRPIDKKALEERAQAVGITDEELLAELGSYRQVRKELVHEKAVPFSQDKSPLRVAQVEAKKAVDLMERLEAALRLNTT
jgi:hypothetical protein